MFTKRFFGRLTLIVGVMLVFSFASCVTFATNRDVPQKTTPILSTVSSSLLPQGTEIASYMQVAGIPIGYDDFVQKVAGKDYDVVVKSFFVANLVRISAVAK